ncbi:DUF937 domain-containing protein [Siculibacillus lacustris]|uniref:DUF937 domain-containing protein n=1 Tax=Siculibacillus lacustris TaxID=1549641 RepID=A0A4Q9VNF5_9HYPH|nr:DUF937 domain-containing protein [Siculibacillus lacustris]TBW37206.1 DUF937 domain-containing protein [Siculibacillus lacustris]
MLEPAETMRRFVDLAKVGEAAARFGLTPDQATSAVDALRPALAAALRRRAADPRGLAEMMGFVKPKPDFAAAMPGGEALGRLFGSRELTGLVIDQVAGFSGVDKRTLEIVLPIAGETLMANFAAGLRSHPLTEALGAAFEPKPRAAPTLDEILTDTIGPNTARLVGKTLKETPNPLGPSNPFGEILGEFMRGFNNGGPPIDEPLRPEDVVPPPGDTVGRLFEAGREAQVEQARAFEVMFDRFWAEAAAAEARRASADGTGPSGAL